MGKTLDYPILRLIRKVVADQGVRDASDHDLLHRFRYHGDEAAFHALVCRHGAMVFDVCRGILRNEANAEDAFQATFLILARKAQSIRKSASVGSWLHRVACRTALRARAQEATRKRIEVRVPTRQISEADDLTWREVRAVLHEELNNLPERYRAALLMCYLESRTQDTAAAQLGVAKSTLKERLDRARQLLGARLAGRGLGPAAVLVAAAWPASVSSGCLPLSLVSATARSAGQSVAGLATPGEVSANVAALAKGVLKSMFLTKLKTAIAAAVLLVALAGGSGLIYQTTTAMEPMGSDRMAAGVGLGIAVADIDRDHWLEGEDGKAPNNHLLTLQRATKDKEKDEEKRTVPRSVLLDDGERRFLDPEGLLITKELGSRYIVGWDGPLTLAESNGPIRVRLADAALTLDLRNFDGGRQAVVRLRAVGGEARVELRLRRTTGKYPVRLEIQPAQEEREVDVRVGSKAVRLALRPSASEVEVEALKGAVSARVMHSGDR
jgi:RNA polymerase sigma factor (sigma-70 family)